MPSRCCTACSPPTCRPSRWAAVRRRSSSTPRAARPRLPPHCPRRWRSSPALPIPVTTTLPVQPRIIFTPRQKEASSASAERSTAAPSARRISRPCARMPSSMSSMFAPRAGSLRGPPARGGMVGRLRKPRNAVFLPDLVRYQPGRAERGATREIRRLKTCGHFRSLRALSGPGPLSESWPRLKTCGHFRSGPVSRPRSASPCRRA